MNDRRWDELIAAARAASEATGLPVAEVSLDDIARHAGISRATLYRRIGSRAALEDAIRAAGIDPGGRADVRERATEAAANLIEEGGLAALTLEAVAERAACSVRALHTQIGGRDGLLGAIFERYSPLPQIEQAMSGGSMPLADGVRAIYDSILDSARVRPGLLAAVVADVAFRPDGPTAEFVRATYLPRVANVLAPWLEARVQSGEIRPLPIPLLIKLLVGPMGAHVFLGPAIARMTGLSQPSPDAVCEELTAAFLRAVARAPTELGLHD
ncbi:MAG TPA: TetR family transcriptional regulator [Thermomicrobiales bacterium]|nr:TetR family transcriptional regulator [Thermomicrobiales bacterium]